MNPARTRAICSWVFPRPDLRSARRTDLAVHHHGVLPHAVAVQHAHGAPAGLVNPDREDGSESSTNIMGTFTLYSNG